jgi:hypothetical protein
MGWRVMRGGGGTRVSGCGSVLNLVGGSNVGGRARQACMSASPVACRGLEGGEQMHDEDGRMIHTCLTIIEIRLRHHEL